MQILVLFCTTVFPFSLFQRFTKITTIGRRAAFIPDDVEGANEINLDEEVKSGRLVQITAKQVGKNSSSMCD